MMTLETRLAVARARSIHPSTTLRDRIVKVETAVQEWHDDNHPGVWYLCDQRPCAELSRVLDEHFAYRE